MRKKSVLVTTDNFHNLTQLPDRKDFIEFCLRGKLQTLTTDSTIFYLSNN